MIKTEGTISSQSDNMTIYSTFYLLTCSYRICTWSLFDLRLCLDDDMFLDICNSMSLCSCVFPQFTVDSPVLFSTFFIVIISSRAETLPFICVSPWHPKL